MLTQGELADLADRLRAIVALVESGGLPAEADQVEQLRGALAAVQVLAAPVSQPRL